MCIRRTTTIPNKASNHTQKKERDRNATQTYTNKGSIKPINRKNHLISQLPCPKRVNFHQKKENCQSYEIDRIPDPLRKQRSKHYTLLPSNGKGDPLHPYSPPKTRQYLHITFDCTAPKCYNRHRTHLKSNTSWNRCRSSQTSLSHHAR
jgi:hypothetical protein